MQIKIVIGVLLLVGVCGRMVYMSELFRHGARYPTSDIYDGKDTKAFHGLLTGIGMRQHYLLGTYLAKDYIQALNISSVINPQEVEVFTESSARCVESAYSHMAGWFPLGSGGNIPAGLDPSFLEPPFQLSANILSTDTVQEPGTTQGYQPVPIRGAGAFFPSCPNEAQLMTQRIEAVAAAVAILQAEEQSFMLKIKNIFNLSIALANVAGMAELYDVVVSDQHLGRQLPSNFTEKDFEELKFIQNYLFALVYADHLARTYSTPLAQSIIDKMEMVVAGKYGRKKLTVYSGHDTNVAPVLTFLNLTSSQCIQKRFRNKTMSGNCAEPVPFASSLQVELHLKDQLVSEARDPASYFVKVRYNGDYYYPCEGDSLECNFEVFSSRVRHSMVDFKKECGVKEVIA